MPIFIKTQKNPTSIGVGFNRSSITKPQPVIVSESTSPVVEDNRTTKEARLNICNDCPEKIVSTVPIVDIELDRCGKCGCLLATRVYTSCPIGKW